MNFDLSPEQALIRDSYARFCDKELTPAYARWYDENCSYLPQDMYDKFAALGTQGLTVPQEYGGQGLGMIEMALVLEEISKRSVAAAFCVGGSQAFGARPLGELGTPAQKQQHLPRIAAGQEKWSLALSEPAGGTDILGAIRTTATRKGDRYVLNGAKQWITGAHVADYLLTVAITDPAAPRKKGLSVLIVDARSRGVTIRPIPKLGIHGCGTNAIFFDDVEVPAENLVGTEHNGWYELLRTLNPERVTTAVFSLGIAQAAFDYALAYAKERQAFGRPIGGFQILQHYLADIALEIELARNLVYRCAWMADHGRPYHVEVAMAKIAACRASELAARHGMEILGGYGYAMEYDMQRHFRDYKQMMFSPISDEMAKNQIAESFGLPRSF